jgi:hypothetical protein
MKKNGTEVPFFNLKTILRLRELYIWFYAMQTQNTFLHFMFTPAIFTSSSGFFYEEIFAYTAQGAGEIIRQVFPRSTRLNAVIGIA